MKLKSIFLALAATGLVSAASAIVIPAPRYVEGHVIVKFKASATPLEKLRASKWLGAEVQSNIPQLRAQVIQLPFGVSVQKALTHYRSLSTVQYAEPDYIKDLHVVPNDPMIGQQYGFSNIRAFTAWDINKGRPGVTIAVLDNGCDINHPDLKNKVSQPWDFVDNDPDPSPVPNPENDSHGTHTAGIVGAETNNNIGVAGTSFNCRIMPLRVGHGFGIITSAELPGIVYAADHGAKVISMSFGGFFQDQAEIDALNYAWAKDVVLVASAGNHGNGDGSDGLIPAYPAQYENVISVAASDQGDGKASFSAYGPNVDVTAPGVDILSTFPNNNYEAISGTSMSCPMTSGVVGLLWSHAINGTTNQQIVDALLDNCDPISYVHYGRVNAFKALKSLIQRTTVDVTPVFLGMLEGTPLTSTGRVLAADGNYFEIAPKSVPRLGFVASAYYRFELPVETSIVESVVVSVTGQQSAGSTGQVYLWNWVTGRWDNVKSYPIGATDSTFSAIVKSSLSAYASENGEVRALVRSVKPIGLTGSGAPLKIDQLVMKVTYIQQ